MCPSWKRNCRNHHAEMQLCIRMFWCHLRLRLPAKLSTRTASGQVLGKRFGVTRLWKIFDASRWCIAGKFSENCATLLRVGCEQSLFLSLVDLASQREEEIWFFPLSRASYSLTSARLNFRSHSLTRSTREREGLLVVYPCESQAGMVVIKHASHLYDHRTWAELQLISTCLAGFLRVLRFPP